MKEAHPVHRVKLRSLLSTLAMLFLAGAGLGSSDAFAQTQIEGSDPTDAGAFIEGLAELELDAVIERLMVDPPEDPERAKAVRDALAGSWLARQSESSEQFLTALQRVLQYSEKLPRPGERGVFWAAPVWAADLGQNLLFRGLPGFQNAGDFVLFGVPTRGQLEATTRAAEATRSRLEDAENQFVQIQMTLRRQRDFVREYVNTGKWDRLTRYMELNVPYYRAWATAHLVAQDLDGAFFAGVEDPANRKARLLNAATSDVRALVARRDALPLNDDNLARLDILSAVLAVERGASEEAIDAAVRATRYNRATPYTVFLAKLARAKALHVGGKVDAAAELVETLRADQFTRSHPLRMVLVADRQFLLIRERAERLAEADAKAELLAEAFAVYERLLESDAASPWADALRGFVERRYQHQVPTWAEGDLLPPTVRFAAVRRDYQQADRLLKEGKHDQAMDKFKRVIEETAAMLEGDTPTMERDFEAEVRFFRATAMYRSGDSLSALDNYLLIADRFADHARGEQSMRIAYTNILRPSYVMKRDNPQLVAKMEQAFGILFEKYPTLTLTRTARYHYAAFLREQGRHIDAVAAYSELDRDHPNYFAARYEELVSRAALWQDPPELDPESDEPFPGNPEAVIRSASQFIELAERRVETGDPAVPDNIDQQLANAYLIRAQVMLQDQGKAGEAMEDVDHVAANFGDLEGMANRITAIRIRGLQQQGKFVEAERLLEDYMQRAPGRAAPLAAGVLKGLADEAQRRAAEGAEVDPLVDAVVKLADTLVLPWARERAQRFTFPQKLAFELQPVEALMAAEDWQGVLDRVNRIVERYGDPAAGSLELVTAKAQAQYHLGQLNEAHENFTRIYRGLAETHAKSGGEKAVSPQFWEAALFLARTQEKLADGQTNPRIASFIQRALQAYGPAPERYADPLNRLRAEHRRQRP